MPFKSEKQRKWMHANEPEMAKKWEKEETIEGKLRNLIKQEIKSINEGFDKYYLSGLLDSRLKKKLEIAIKNLKGKVDGVGTDYIWFRMPSSNVDLLAALITKLDRNKNVWIGDKRKNNIWDRRQKINKLEAFRPKGVSHMNKIVFLPKSKLYFDPSNGNFWLMGPGGDPDWNDEPIEPKDRDYKRTLSRLSSKDKSIMKKSLRGSGNWKEATTSVSVPGYLSPKAFSKSTQNAIDVDDEDDEKSESVNEDNIKFSKEEMAQLHKDGKVEKGGHTIEFNESINEGKKRFKVGFNIGKAKYVISHHDGREKHKDGSDFFGISIYKNQKAFEKGQEDLKKKGYIEESVNESPMAPFSSSEAKQHINQDIKKMSKHLGKASQQSIKIMMDGVKSGKYTAMDISRGIKEGPAGRAHFGELGFLQQLWNKVRDGFRRYTKDRKLS